MPAMWNLVTEMRGLNFGGSAVYGVLSKGLDGLDIFSRLPLDVIYMLDVRATT